MSLRSKKASLWIEGGRLRSSDLRIHYSLVQNGGDGLKGDRLNNWRERGYHVRENKLGDIPQNSNIIFRNVLINPPRA